MADRVLRELNVARQQPHVYIEHLKARRTMMVRGSYSVDSLVQKKNK